MVIVCNCVGVLVLWLVFMFNTTNMIVQPKNPLHGVTLKMILEFLIEELGFVELGERIKIKCFTDKPTLNSSLVFLRKTPWAREKVERLYLQKMRQKQKREAKNEIK